MRWSYDAPSGKLFVLDGKYAWFYTPGDAQVSRAPAKQLDDLRSPLRLLLGHTQLAKELERIASEPDGANFRITGVPKGMAQRVHLLTLHCRSQWGHPAHEAGRDGRRNHRVHLQRDQEDIALPPADFIFTPPPGIPIVAAQPPIRRAVPM